MSITGFAGYEEVEKLLEGQPYAVRPSGLIWLTSVNLDLLGCRRSCVYSGNVIPEHLAVFPDRVLGS